MSQTSFRAPGIFGLPRSSVRVNYVTDNIITSNYYFVEDYNFTIFGFGLVNFCKPADQLIKI
jgi:hypothetical protein